MIAPWCVSRQRGLRRVGVPARNLWALTWLVQSRRPSEEHEAVALFSSRSRSTFGSRRRKLFEPEIAARKSSCTRSSSAAPVVGCSHAPGERAELIPARVPCCHRSRGVSHFIYWRRSRPSHNPQNRCRLGSSHAGWRCSISFWPRSLEPRGQFRSREDVQSDPTASAVGIDILALDFQSVQ